MRYCSILILLFTCGLWAQQDGNVLTASQVKKSYFTKAEYYLEKDDIPNAQRWLDKVRILHQSQTTDTLTVYIHSLQSELFYYDGLFQLGKNEAIHSLQKAVRLHDSLMIADAYFFLAINQIEIFELNSALRNLNKAAAFFPQKIQKKRLRSSIQREHIYNNTAQTLLKLKQYEKALAVNRKAYRLALATNSKRGIPNSEQTFGEIYIGLQQKDSATYYLKKSIVSAFNFNYYDIALINYGLLMECHREEPNAVKKYYTLATELMEKQLINPAFKALFFQKAAGVMEKYDTALQNLLLHRLVALQSEKETQSNFYLQKIAENYIKNEKKILHLELQKLKKQKDLARMQLFFAVLLLLLLGLITWNIRRKNQVNLTLLQQKNDISKDLHDDIGSGISSILIHSDLLLHKTLGEEASKSVVTKISLTAKELSQRMSAFVWSLNDEYNTVDNFSNYIRNYAEKLLEETGIILSYESDIQGIQHRDISGTIRKNLFLSFKEILNNSLKHASASAIHIHLSSQQHVLELTVKDNGRGLSNTQLWGNGLKNIQKRMDEIRGSFAVSNDNGLRVVLKVPLM